MTHCPAIRLFLATLFVAHLGFAQKITTMLKDIDPGAAGCVGAATTAPEACVPDGTPGCVVVGGVAHAVSSTPNEIMMNMVERKNFRISSLLHSFVFSCPIISAVP